MQFYMMCVNLTTGCSSEPRQWGAAAEVTRGCRRSADGDERCCSERHQETSGQQAGGKQEEEELSEVLWGLNLWAAQHLLLVNRKNAAADVGPATLISFNSKWCRSVFEVVSCFLSECSQAGGSSSHSDHRCCSARRLLQQEPGGTAAARPELQGNTQKDFFKYLLFFKCSYYAFTSFVWIFLSPMKMIKVIQV